MPLPPTVTTVGICHEFDITRTGLRAMLDAEPDLDVIADTGDVDRICSMVGQSDPDVLIVSISAVEALTTLDQLDDRHRNRPAVVALVTERDEEALLRALLLGVRGVAHFGDAGRFVVEATRAVARGDAFLAPTAATLLIDRIVESLPDAEAVTRIRRADLTRREHEVLHLVAAGLTTSEMARTLGITGATVKSHLSRLLMKLGMRERVQAAALAHRAGLARSRLGPQGRVAALTHSSGRGIGGR